MEQESDHLSISICIFSFFVIAERATTLIIKVGIITINPALFFAWLFSFSFWNLYLLLVVSSTLYTKAM